MLLNGEKNFLKFKIKAFFGGFDISFTPLAMTLYPFLFHPPTKNFFLRIGFGSVDFMLLNGEKIFSRAKFKIKAFLGGFVPPSYLPCDQKSFSYA